MEGQVLRFDEGAQGFVVGHHGGDIDIQMLCAPAIEDVVQAVIGFGDHDNGFDRLFGIENLPGHGESIGYGREGFFEGFQAFGTQRAKDDAHEELARERVVELRGFLNVAFGVCQACRHGGNDAGFVITVKA